MMVLNKGVNFQPAAGKAISRDICGTGACYIVEIVDGEQVRIKDNVIVRKMK
jgi:hypothetical protein